MDRSDRIAERLPSFYDVWRVDSILRRFIDGFSTQLEGVERKIFIVMESRWIDVASGEALDMLGSMFGIKRRSKEDDDSFRNRIRRSIRSFMGGGTVEAVKRSVAAVLNISPGEVGIVENPERPGRRVAEVFSGSEWSVDCGSVLDEEVELRISVSGGVGRAVFPEVRCVETGFVFRFKGELRGGSEIVVSKDGVFLDGEQLSSDRYVVMGSLYLPRGVSTWRYSERLAPSMGVFDRARFDEAVFAFEVPATRIEFRWVRHVPSFFEIHIPVAVDSSTMEVLDRSIRRVKACGVGYEVVVGEKG